MKIGIDARLISQTGVGVYVYNLLRELQSILPRDWEVMVYIRSEDEHLVPKGKYKVRFAPYRWHSLSEQTSFLTLLNIDKLDLMHFTYFSYPALYNRPFISTIHDLTPVLFKTGKASTKSVFQYYPKYFAMKKVIHRAINNAGGIIVPTQAVKRQIGSLYGEDKLSKVFVTYEAVNSGIIRSKENKNLSKQFKKPFFIYVGNFYPHKNIPALLNAYQQISTDIQLILIGPEDHFSKSIQEEVNRLNLSTKVSFYHNPSLNDLVFFYKNAQALIHPSLSEGFGLTPIEAMNFGCPVIASDIPVFHETMEDQYISFDPNNIQSIQRAIGYFIEKKPVYDTEKIRAKYSFSQMASETLNVYKQVLQKGV